MSAEPTEFWTFDGTTLQAWEVISRTARTFRVKSSNKYLPGWQRTVMSSAIGKKFHLTPKGAMTVAIADAEREIGFLKQRLHIRRSALGMFRVLLKTCESAQAVDAVDPSAGTQER